MLTEDLKIMAEESGFCFYTYDGRRGLEADGWEAVNILANKIVNVCLQKIAGQHEKAERELLDFINFKLASEFRKYGIFVDLQKDQLPKPDEASFKGDPK